MISAVVSSSSSDGIGKGTVRQHGREPGGAGFPEG